MTYHFEKEIILIFSEAHRMVITGGYAVDLALLIAQ